MSEILPGTVFRPRSPGEAMQQAQELSEKGAAGFIVGMPEEQYHSRQELSASGMKVLLRSPKHFQQARAVRVTKPEFDVGHAIHARVLGVGLPVVQIDPKLLSSDGGIRSNAAKAEVERIRTEGGVPLKPETYQRVVRASDAVLANRKARRLLEVPGVSEVSMFATDPQLELALRGRADRISVDPSTGAICILDAKSCVDLSTRKLQMTVDDYGYDLQAEAYRLLVELITGLIAEPVVLIFMEKEAPFDVRVVRLGDQWMDGGWQKLRRAMESYKRAVEERSWPGVDDGDGPIEELAVPGWYAGRIESESEGNDEW